MHERLGYNNFFAKEVFEIPEDPASDKFVGLGLSDKEFYERIANYGDYFMFNDDCIRCRHILVDDNDIDLAIYESLKATRNVCLRDGNPLHPLQEKVLKEYEEKIRSRK